jgi:predicted enzyme related to lactoylglutathione lyase
MDMGEAGTYTILTNTEGRQIGGCMDLGMLPEGTPAHWNVYFNVEDVDACVTKAETLGAKTVAPAMDVPGVGRMAMVSDPQGAMFWVMAGETAA